MKAAVTFEASAREESGKGAARAVRREGRVPAIVYGKGQKNVTLSLQANELTREYLRGGFFNKLLEIKTDGENIFALTKDIQLHPVSDKIEHIDFLRVTKESRIGVRVPVRFQNQDKCIGIKRGGTLNVVRHDVELVCAVGNIPTHIEIDLKDAAIGDSIHISQISLPEDVTPAITDRDFTVATIAGRKAKEDSAGEEAEGEEAAAEGAS